MWVYFQDPSLGPDPAQDVGLSGCDDDLLGSQSEVSFKADKEDRSLGPDPAQDVGLSGCNDDLLGSQSDVSFKADPEEPDVTIGRTIHDNR